MIDLFKPFKGFLKLDNVCIDNNVFRMHYKITVIMLLIFTLLLTSKQFFGDPIHCIGSDDDKIDKDAMNSYCWIYGTYTLKSGAPIINGRKMYHGMGPDTKEDRIEHTYYQWVCFVLLGQAAMFYTPRYLWKIWEGGRLKALASDLAGPFVAKDWPECRRGELLAYMSQTDMYSHNIYALRYAFCEILNLLNVVGQMFLLDVFLGGAFRDYGASVAAFTHSPRVPTIDPDDFASVNPMDKYFPKVTKCFFRKVGPSGTTEYRDRLCILPLNIVNEKIFVIIWFWFIILTIISTLAVLFRILVFSSTSIRTVMTMGHMKQVKRNCVSKVVKRFGFGDWFVLYLLGKNINPRIYRELIIELSKNMDPQYPI